MVKIYVVVLLLFQSFLSPLFGQEYVKPEEGSLKVISYNIWNGFEWGKDSVRRLKLVEWIGSHGPDIVALQELCGFTNEKLSELEQHLVLNCLLLPIDQRYSLKDMKRMSDFILSLI